jgi:alanine racemase
VQNQSGYIAIMNSSGILTIDLGAIQSNWQFVNSQSLDATETGAVVKANAYGLGALKVVASLYDAGCRTFFFATKEEAIAVKALFPADLTMIILGGVRPGDEPAFIESQLIPVLYSFEAIERWVAGCNQQSVAAPCVVKVDTGMTRFGLGFDELKQLAQSAFHQPRFNPVLLMSHLACADEHMHPQNRQQLQNFKNVVDIFKHHVPQIRCSLANSSGVFLGKEWHFDLLRPGAALYGVNPTPHLPNPLKPVVHLSLPILQVKTLSEDVFVGYGASYKAKKGSRLAVVAGGYADGVHRTLGLKPLAKFADRKIEAVGRVSMDTTIFDISNINLPEASLVGQFINVIDDELSLDFLTRRNSSLGYEVLTSLGSRFKRIYLE